MFRTFLTLCLQLDYSTEVMPISHVKSTDVVSRSFRSNGISYYRMYEGITMDGSSGGRPGYRRTSKRGTRDGRYEVDLKGAGLAL